VVFEAGLRRQNASQPVGRACQLHSILQKRVGFGMAHTRYGSDRRIESDHKNFNYKEPA
jgi:hypothetical protein